MLILIEKYSLKRLRKWETAVLSACCKSLKKAISYYLSFSSLQLSAIKLDLKLLGGDVVASLLLLYLERWAVGARRSSLYSTVSEQ